MRFLLRSTDRNALFISSALVEHHATHTTPSGICIGCSWECTRSRSPLKKYYSRKSDRSVFFFCIYREGSVGVDHLLKRHIEQYRVIYVVSCLTWTRNVHWTRLCISSTMGFARNAKRDRNGIHIRIENNNNKIRHLMLEYKWWIVLSVTNKPFYGLLHPLEMNSSFLHRKSKENATYSPVQYKNSSTANPPLNLFVDSSRDEVHFQLLILLSFRLFNPQRPRSRISPPLKGGPPIVPSGCLKKMPFSIAHHNRANN